MADATTTFFEELAARGHEPLLEKATGSIRFDMTDGGRQVALARRDRQGRPDGVAPEREGRLRRPRREGALRRDREGQGERGRRLPPRRDRHRRRPPAAGHLPACSSLDLRGGRHERRLRPNPRREHVRGQRLARRHRGVADRSNRPLLVRHAVPLDLDPHRRRPAPQPALGGRPPVLRVALLPRSRHRHRLRRREALGHPSPRGRRRVPRGAHDPQPRREAGRAHRPHRGRLRLRRTCSRSRTRSRRRARYSTKVVGKRLVLGYRRGTYVRETTISGVCARRRSTSTA